MKLIPISSIRKVLDYLYLEEYEDFISQDKPPDHIFLSIQVVSEWLDGFPKMEHDVE